MHPEFSFFQGSKTPLLLLHWAWIAPVDLIQERLWSNYKTNSSLQFQPDSISYMVSLLTPSCRPAAEQPSGFVPDAGLESSMGYNPNGSAGNAFQLAAINLALNQAKD